MHLKPISLSWDFDWSWDPAFSYVTAPLWVLPILPLAIAAIVWRFGASAQRRAQLGSFPACQPCRRDLPVASPCPECGTTADER
jgi:hypothetical protein